MDHQRLTARKHQAQGREVAGYDVGVYNESGEELLQFRLEFSGKGWFSKALFVPLAPEVALKMHHPANCPCGKPTQKKASSPKKRKRRKR